MGTRPKARLCHDEPMNSEDDREPPAGFPPVPHVSATEEDVANARWSYERLVDHYEERTGREGIHWERLTSLEQQYWTRLHIALRS